MIADLREWTFSVILCALFLSLAQSLIPKGTLGRIASLAGGLLLLLCLLQPLLRGRDPLVPDWSDLQQELETRQQELLRETETQLAERISAQTASYISEQARRLGTEVTASVQTQRQNNGVILPVQAELRGKYSRELEACISLDLGIPPERQVWHEGEN